jgi:hypothetical protein
VTYPATYVNAQATSRYKPHFLGRKSGQELEPKRPVFLTEGVRLSVFAITRNGVFKAAKKRPHGRKVSPSTRGRRFSSGNGKQQKLSLDPEATQHKEVSHQQHPSLPEPFLPFSSQPNMADGPNSIKLLTGNSHPELAQLVAKR